MTLQAEIQKRQQSVSELKRQVEQISALAGDDKKAGIRLADALRKRKLRASLKGVQIRETADVQRRLANSADIDSCEHSAGGVSASPGPTGRPPQAALHISDHEPAIPSG